MLHSSSENTGLIRLKCFTKYVCLVLSVNAGCVSPHTDIGGVITLAVSGTGTRTRTMEDNRCQLLSLFRYSVKGST